MASQTNMVQRHFQNFPFPSDPQMKGGNKAKHAYCSSFNNNKGKCERGQNCLFLHVCEKCGAHFIDKYVQESNDQGLCPNQIPPVNSSQNLLQETPILRKLNINSTVVTPIKVEKFVNWLQGYNEKEKYFLQIGFKFGSDIPYVGKREYIYSKNLKSANENPDILREIFFKEDKAGRDG